MFIRKIKFRKPLFFAAVILLFNIAFYLPYITHSEANANLQESKDFLSKTSQAMSDVVEAVKPAVVNISTTKTIKTQGSVNPLFEDPFFKRFFGDQFDQMQRPRERKATSLGSGVIVTSDGYIVTNNHVVKDADEITVLLSDKRELIGKLIASDPKTDISVIKVEAEGLPTATWGNSDELKVGGLVMAIGSPYGLNQTVTSGIVSALGRENVGISDYEDFIQTDAAINPGNSGGALINAKGELVGINTAIYSTSGGYQGIGFAIPSNMAKRVLDSLVEKGKVIRGWLGVSVQPITPELAKQFQLIDNYGALITEVNEGGPAEKAGLLRGDVIVEFNNVKVDEPANLRNSVANTLPGEEVKVVVIRDGKLANLKITITELSAASEKPANALLENALMGVTTQDITPDIYKELSIPQKLRGVVISNVAEDSPAVEKLIRGDVILEINRKAVSNNNDFNDFVSKIKPEEDMLLLVYRKGASIFVPLIGKKQEEIKK
ncbi:MAG: DegQ family serine endoprotease [Thermodesulfovibrionia bacterium]|nr:DegQ family serine endoprotease [Thermodesulfovibrionia bacterium]